MVKFVVKTYMNLYELSILYYLLNNHFDTIMLSFACTRACMENMIKFVVMVKMFYQMLITIVLYGMFFILYLLTSIEQIDPFQ